MVEQARSSAIDLSSARYRGADISIGNEGEFSRDPNVRLGEVLATVNVSPKSVLLMMFRTQRHILTQAEVRFGFNEIYKETEFGESNYRTVIKYCKNTLAKRGFLNDVAIDPSGAGFARRVGFSLTEAGELYARPAAALALDFENRHEDISLYGIFRKGLGSAEEKNLSPYVRAKILLSLSEKSAKVRTLDLARELNVRENVVGRALEDLCAIGLVDYEAVQPNTGRVEVSFEMGKVDKSQVKGEHMSQRMPQLIMDICRELSEEGAAITENAVKRRIPEGFTIIDRGVPLQRVIATWLSKLSEQEFLKRGKYKSREVLSEAAITEKGKLVVEELLRPLVAIMEDDEDTRNAVVLQIIPRVEGALTQIARDVFPKYFEHSHMHKLREIDRNRQVVRSGVPNYPSAVSSRELSEPSDLTSSTVKRFLESEIKNGSVIIVKLKGVSYFSRLEAGMVASEEVAQNLIGVLSAR